MKPAGWPSYEVADYEILAQAPGLRMVTITLAAGQEVPWHWHTNIADRFFCGRCALGECRLCHQAHGQKRSADKQPLEPDLTRIDHCRIPPLKSAHFLRCSLNVNVHLNDNVHAVKAATCSFVH